MTGTTGIIIQARMGSTRLPGKVLKPLAGKPMLARILGRFQHCRRADRVVLATSDRIQDDPVAALAGDLGMPVFRGSESDVLDRYRQCARAFGFTAIVRATGDNPFVDVEEADRLIAFHHASGLDYAANVGGLPIGVGVEIMTMAALERSWREGLAPHHREHVNEYILENPALFRQEAPTIPPEKLAPTLRLTVDTPEDFAFAEALLVAGPEEEPDTVTLIRRCRERAGLAEREG